MAYTTIDDPTLFFSTTVWTGNGSNNRDIVVEGTGMQPDFIWLKGRTNSGWHYLFNSVVGSALAIHSNVDNAQSNQSYVLTDPYYNANGFRVGVDNDVNGSSRGFVAWTWKAGTTFSNDASSTSVGTIDSSGTVNTTAGFSIVTWVGTGSNGTIAHALGSVPKMMLIKDRSNARDWQVYHVGFGNTGSAQLNETAVFSTDGMFQNTDPTSTVFSVGTSVNVNASSANLIAYCFAEKKGYSKFGTYVGNGAANGTFVYLGFKPSFVIRKRIAGEAGLWHIVDNKREGFNGSGSNDVIYANADAVEGDANRIDLLSNGFKVRTTDGDVNGSGASYIYMAFAENPFVNSEKIPINAR
tara:strand:- start:64 stop:1125 length:1062 start_codon:yes stop_codon:yes gene_type:complete